MKTMLIALTACATLALAGCGDDGNKKDESSALTKAEFITQGDSICKAGTDKIGKAEEGFADPANPTEAEITKAVDQILVPELTSELEKLRDLEPPAEDKDEIDSMLDSLEKAIAALDEDWKTGLNSQHIEDANKKAADYGFKECGED